MPRRTPIWLALASCAAALSACAGRSTTTDTRAGGDVSRPAVDLGGLGLEVRGWVVDDRDQRLARRLAAFEAGDALSAEADAAWQACGLRVVQVPTDQLSALAESLVSGPESRVWLGQTPQWTEAYATAESESRRAVRMPEGDLVLAPGAIRLLVRAWFERAIVDEQERRNLRVDLVPQNRERTFNSLTLEPIDPTRPLDVGLVIDRLASVWRSDGSTALLLVPADAGEDWEAIAAQVGPPEYEPGVFGPPMRTAPTLGQALLGTPRDGFDIVLVLIPRTQQ
ncbi:MAG: hypothetical protein R3B68_15800 [Phycisphaerales bacterium]